MLNCISNVSLFVVVFLTCTASVKPNVSRWCRSDNDLRREYCDSFSDNGKIISLRKYCAYDIISEAGCKNRDHTLNSSSFHPETQVQRKTNTPKKNNSKKKTCLNVLAMLMMDTPQTWVMFFNVRLKSRLGWSSRMMLESWKATS